MLRLSAAVMNLIGIASAIVIFVTGNALGSRFFARWDVTSDGLYTLSDPTLQTLDGLRDDIEIVVFLSQSDPLSGSVRYMLDAYRARSSHIVARYVDPDRDPVQFIALQREYGIFEGRTDDGRLASEASIVIARGEKRWYVTTDDIVVFDEEQGQARPRLEAVLTEGIVNVQQREQVQVCFTQGHQELSVSSGGPQGLAEFRRRLEQNNYRVREANLAVAEPAKALAGCDCVAIVGPLAPFEQQSARALREHVEAGGSLLLSVGPLVDESGAINDPGLAPLLGDWGIAFGRNLVFEREESLTMPVGFGGEVFLATPQQHPINRGLLVGPDVRQRVVVQLVQSVRLDGGSDAVALLESSPQSIEVGSFKGLQSGEFLDTPARAEGERVLAAALELPSHRREGNRNAARIVVVGTTSVLWSSAWLEPALLGTRRFAENAISWLAAQPVLVSVPEKAEQPAGLFLTEDSLAQVRSYVLLYIPLSVVLLGAFVVYRRRKESDASTAGGES